MKNNKTGKSINEAYKPGQDRPHTFYRWCQDNGRRYVGGANFEEFEANAEAYEAYRAAWNAEYATYVSNAKSTHTLQSISDEP